MTKAYKKYTEYKDSGIDWLGQIPSHWEVRRNKYIFQIHKKLVGKKSNEYDLLSLTLNGIIKRDMVNPQGKFPTEFDAYQEVKKGDFVFCLFDIEETPRTIGLSNFDGMITGAYTVLRNNPNFRAKFLYYFYLNLDNDKRMRSLYKGLRNTISKENFLSFLTFLPPLSEQEKIAEFLDKKTVDIDTAIAQKEQLIELLKERKQILINKAVTRGLNPDVEYKDSGIDWIGSIPKHWDVRKLKYCVDLVSIKADVKNSSLPYIGMENIESKTGKFIDTDTEVEGLGTLFSVNNILFGKLRPYLAKVFLASTNGICSSEFLVYKTNNKTICPTHFKYVLLSTSFIRLIDSSTYGSKMPRANSEYIGNQKLPLPPLSEQREIVNYIEEHSAQIDKAIALKQQEIEVLKEYKATLIDSAVRGKICLV